MQVDTQTHMESEVWSELEPKQVRWAMSENIPSYIL